MLAREVGAELDHFLGVVHGDDVLGRAGEELGKRALARTQIRDDHWRQQSEEKVRQPLPRTARAVAATEFSG